MATETLVGRKPCEQRGTKMNTLCKCGHGKSKHTTIFDKGENVCCGGKEYCKCNQFRRTKHAPDARESGAKIVSSKSKGSAKPARG